ncbi:hypothetical protein NC653_010878 [Populus alba x Populus x berolinensis]|uniref:Uncharacterized protein n=1 Tax=Populus alba x Populus x berolinensis TaxID=444605 RepID=A0AAD6W5N7_9ROSI|nr:hypothetical protein NC653_010878 [Populus alba x Populus x berolinensis]
MKFEGIRHAKAVWLDRACVHHAS